MGTIELKKSPSITQIEYEQGLQFRVGSLDKEADLEEAVQIIKYGGFVACQMRGVFGIWVSGHDASAVQEALLAKGSNLNKPLSTMLPAHKFLPLIDLESVVQPFQEIVQNVDQFRNRLGSMCHIRAPIKHSEIRNIPRSILSNENGRYYIHNLDPYGHRPMEKMIDLLNTKGIKYVAVTSLNDNSINEPEIHDTRRAIEFSLETGVIPLLLIDPTHKRHEAIGSFAIIDFEQGTAIRDGNIPVKVIEKLLEVEIDISVMKESRYKLKADFSHLLELELSPDKLRSAIIDYLSGN